METLKIIEVNKEKVLEQTTTFTKRITEKDIDLKLEMVENELANLQGRKNELLTQKAMFK